VQSKKLGSSDESVVDRRCTAPEVICSRDALATVRRARWLVDTDSSVAG
jgi:hypothetical protein